MLTWHHLLPQMDLNMTKLVEDTQNLLWIHNNHNKIIFFGRESEWVSSTPVFISTVTNYSKQIFPFPWNFLYAVYILLIKSKWKYSIRVLDVFRQPKSNANHSSGHSWLKSFTSADQTKRGVFSVNLRISNKYLKVYSELPPSNRWTESVPDLVCISQQQLGLRPHV